MSFPDSVNIGNVQQTYSSSSSSTSHDVLADSSVQTVQAVALHSFTTRIKEPTFSEPEITRYDKGVVKTKELVPISNEIGKGDYGIVYQHQKYPHLAVKKNNGDGYGQGDFFDEYEIGIKLDHFTIMKTCQLFIKKYPTGREKHALVIEKINGNPIWSSASRSRRYPPETILKLIGQVKSCADYLFGQGICWGDLSVKNILITNDTYDLKFVDLAWWKKTLESSDVNKDYTVFAMELFLNGLDALNGILILNRLKGPELDAIRFTKIFFKIPSSTSENKFGSAYFSIRDGHDRCPFCKYFEDELKKLNNDPEKIHAFLMSYFEAVKTEFQSRFSSNQSS